METANNVLKTCSVLPEFFDISIFKPKKFVENFWEMMYN